MGVKGVLEVEDVNKFLYNVCNQGEKEIGVEYGVNFCDSYLLFSLGYIYHACVKVDL